MAGWADGSELEAYSEGVVNAIDQFAEDLPDE